MEELEKSTDELRKYLILIDERITDLYNGLNLLDEPLCKPVDTKEISRSPRNKIERLDIEIEIMRQDSCTGINNTISKLKAILE